jgi:hypothetical protein
VPEAVINAESGAIVQNISSSILRFNSQQDVLAGKLPAVGDSFFSYFYLFVNYEAGEFSLWPATRTGASNLVAVDSTNTTSTYFCSTSANTAATPLPSSSSSSSSLSGGAIAGIVVGAVAAVALLASAILIIKRRRQYQQSQTSEYQQGAPGQYSQGNPQGATSTASYVSPHASYVSPYASVLGAHGNSGYPGPEEDKPTVPHLAEADSGFLRAHELPTY